MKNLRLLIILLFVVIIAGCYQTKAPTIANIYVKDSVGNAIPKAKVYLYCVTSGCCILPDCRSIDSGTTDLNGYVKFTFKWEAVLRVRCVKDTIRVIYDSNTGSNVTKAATLYAEDWVKLERHKEVEKTVKVGWL